jgi:predicted permease
MGLNIILNQIFIMYFLMTFGYFMVKKGWLNDKGSRQISNILIKAVTPVVIINAFNIKFSISRLRDMALTLVLGIIILGIGFVIARILLGKGNCIEQFAAGFPNVGYFGLPLVQGLLGDEAVFYLTMIIVAYNIYSWTYGVYLISEHQDPINLRILLTTPASIGLWIGLIIFISPLTMPDVLSKSLKMVTSINTPLAMFVLGSYIAKSPLLLIFKEKMIYKTCIIKLLIIPIVIVFILKLIPNYYETLKVVLLIATSSPSGVAMAMFAQQYHSDVFGNMILQHCGS